jgi:hypothetical protein
MHGPLGAIIILRTGNKMLSKNMRKLWQDISSITTAGINGHLFPNRYKSVICEENLYRLDTRYVHLNPLRARIVKNLKEINRYQCSFRHHWQCEAAVAGYRYGACLFRKEQKKERLKHMRMLLNRQLKPAVDRSSYPQSCWMFTGALFRESWQ